MRPLDWQVGHCYQILVLFTLLAQLVFGQQLICENRNPEGHTPRKTEGDGGFQIIVVGNHSTRGSYAPNDVYTVTIQGVKTRYSTQKFTEFLLVAESEKQMTMGQTGVMTTGIFHIIDDYHSRFSDQCPEGVTNVNMQPKTEISILWTAPSTLVASCITFKATVVERPHIWYKDDGQLTKRVCPEMPRRMRGSSRPTATQLHLVNRPQSHLHHADPAETDRNDVPDRKVRRNHGMIKNDSLTNLQPRRISDMMASLKQLQQLNENNRNLPAPANTPRPSIVPPSNPTPAPPVPAPPPPPLSQPNGPEKSAKCCACDEAKYEVRFEGIWSKETHPKDFPENEWLLHFSDIIGSSHSPDIYVWKSGEIASEGIRQVAEWGATRHVETELKSKSRHVNTIIKAKGLWHPDERGTTSAAFRVDKLHHLVSLVSMIGPSPDWIVGISSFNLCLPNCTWMEDANFDLYPYDAGTDSGISYMSPNSPTEPRENIRPLTSTDPDDPRSPFHGLTEAMKPFAKVQIRRQRIYAKGCNDTATVVDHPHEIYLTENSDDISRPECAVSDWTSWSDCSVTCGKGLRMRKRSYMLPMKADMFRCDRQLVEKEMCLGEEQSCAENTSSAFEEFDSVCAVTPWSEWTPCSVTCGKGTRSRFRRYKNKMGRKKCNLEVSQKEMCVITMECNGHSNDTEVNKNCPMTPWSEWTPCSVTCGIGIRERTRFPLLTDEDEVEQNCGSLTTSQRATCTGEFGITCRIGRAEAKEICMLPPDAGSCRMNLTKFHFNTDKSMCVPFEWSGCKGNRNRFETLDECNEVCGFLRTVFNQPTTPVTTSFSTTTPTTTTPASAVLPSSRGTRFPAFTLSVAATTTTAPTTTVATDETTEPPSTASPTRSGGPVTPELQPVDISDLDGEDDDDVKNSKVVTEPELNGEEDKRSGNMDCVVSRWSSWSQCSVTCGTGVKIRSRNVLIQPHNGGKLCPRLQKRKTCRMDPC